MSQFHNKLSEIKQTLNQKIQNQNNNSQQHNHVCSAVELRVKNNNNNNKHSQEVQFQQPIIIEKKVRIVEPQPKQDTARKNISNSFNKTKLQTTKYKKSVESFVPIQIPTREKRNITVQTIPYNEKPQGDGNKQIEIHIEKDDKANKDCLKKLFKKVHKLTEQLAESEKERVRLELQLQNNQKVAKGVAQLQRQLNLLDGERYKLDLELKLLRGQSQEKDNLIQKLRIQIGKAPKEIIKQIIVEKPVQVQVEVPRYVPGPQRIVQKIVQIPKYIEVEKKVTVQVPRDVPRQVTRTIEVPTIVEKIVYVDKPVYIDRPVQVQRRVEVPFEVPVEVPVYVDRPVVEDEWMYRVERLEAQRENLVGQNSQLHHQNNEMRIIIQQLGANIQILRRHNEEKNREVQLLLHNSIDYQPISPHADISTGSIKYSLSSNAHRRII